MNKGREEPAAFGLYVEDTHPATYRHGEVVGAHSTRKEARQALAADPDRDHLTIVEVTA